jgi:hypothetical protein
MHISKNVNRQFTFVLRGKKRVCAGLGAADIRPHLPSQPHFCNQ